MTQVCISISRCFTRHRSLPKKISSYTSYRKVGEYIGLVLKYVLDRNERSNIHRKIENDM